jgi:hypothetical protein
MGHALIVVAQNISNSGDLPPWNIRVTGFQGIRQVAACLGEDFNTTLEQPALALVGFKRWQADTCHFALDKFDGFDNVNQPCGRR